MSTTVAGERWKREGVARSVMRRWPTTTARAWPPWPSKAELYERAQALEIPGRSQMSKRELLRAIRDAD